MSTILQTTQISLIWNFLPLLYGHTPFRAVCLHPYVGCLAFNFQGVLFSLSYIYFLKYLCFTLCSWNYFLQKQTMNLRAWAKSRTLMPVLCRSSYRVLNPDFPGHLTSRIQVAKQVSNSTLHCGQYLPAPKGFRSHLLAIQPTSNLSNCAVFKPRIFWQQIPVGVVGFIVFKPSYHPKVNNSHSWFQVVWSWLIPLWPSQKNKKEGGSGRSPFL